MAIKSQEESQLHLLERRVSLRARLLVGLVTLVIVGLVSAAVIIYNGTRSSLLGQLDQELTSRVGAVGTALSASGFEGNVDFRLYQLGLPEGAFGETLGPGGNASASFRVIDGSKYDAVPNLPSTLAASAANSNAPVIVSASGGGGSPDYRVVAQPVSQGGVVVLAFPLTSVDDTLGNLVWTEIFVILGVTLALGVLALIVIRLGLRPLSGIALTAAAIAEGDLSRRVRNDDPHTEVGRLGRSVNVMLSRIEDAFEKRSASEQRLRQFVADASHELRTPITSIRGYAELYRMGGIETEAQLRDAMRRIEEDATRTGHMVEDLLMLARLDQGRPLERNRVDLVQVSADAIVNASLIQPDREIELDAPASVVVRGDEDRLRQVVANLLENALVYTPETAGITVRLFADESRAILEVVDEGAGIPAEHLDRIFERFYRVDPSRSRSTGGTGLGLSIVASIVEAHGGKVSVSSEKGRGTVFRVQLPTEVEGSSSPAGRSAVDALDAELDAQTAQRH
jgi:two-component system, OmpR family, sensor kinase